MFQDDLFTDFYKWKASKQAGVPTENELAQDFYSWKLEKQGGKSLDDIANEAKNQITNIFKPVTTLAKTMAEAPEPQGFQDLLQFQPAGYQAPQPPQQPTPDIIGGIRAVGEAIEKTPVGQEAMRLQFPAQFDKPQLKLAVQNLWNQIKQQVLQDPKNVGALPPFRPSLGPMEALKEPPERRKPPMETAIEKGVKEPVQEYFGLAKFVPEVLYGLMTNPGKTVTERPLDVLFVTAGHLGLKKLRSIGKARKKPVTTTELKKVARSEKVVPEEVIDTIPENIELPEWPPELQVKPEQVAAVKKTHVKAKEGYMQDILERTKKAETIQEHKIISESKTKLTNPKEQKQWLIEEVDEAYQKAKSSTGKEPTKDTLQEGWRGIEPDKVKFGSITFDVPGDGVFEVINEKHALAKFRKRVKKWPTTSLKIRRPSLPSIKRQPVSEKTLQEIQWEIESGREYIEPIAKQKERLLEQRGITEEQTIRPTDKLADKYYTEAIQDLKKKKQGGFIKFEPKEKKAKLTDAQVQKALSSSRFPQNEIQAIKHKAAQTKQAVKKVFVYEPELKTQPQFRNEVRLFQDVPYDAFLDSNKRLIGTVGKLSKTEMSNFEKYLPLKSYEARAKRGLTVPYDLTLEQIQKSLTELEPTITPKIQEAVQRHVDFMKGEHEMLVSRGKLDPESGFIDDVYFPHIIMEYHPIWTSWHGVPKRFKAPFREYTRRAVGSAKPIEVNYIKVMTDHYTKVYLDNAIDDFMSSSVTKYDVMETLSKADKELHFGKSELPQPRLVYEIDGKEYQGFQFDKGHVFYPARNVNEGLLQKALAEGLTTEEWLSSEGPRGGKPLNEALSIGGEHKVYLLPKEIARKLEYFREPSGNLPGFWALRDFMSWWKRMTLDFAGLPFQVGNLYGDLMNLYKTDPAAFSKVGDAAQIMVRQAYFPERLTEAQLSILEKAREQRVTTTHMLREVGIAGLGAQKLRQLQGSWNPVNWVGEIFYQIEKGSMTREGVARLAKFMKDMERIQKGEMVKSMEIDVKGLDPISAAGKVAREFTVDYGAVPKPYKQFLRGALAPFMTFYDFNARNWFKYIAKHPGDFAVKVGIPTAAVWTWNNTGERAEIEKNLGFWRYLPHVITGFKNKDEKPIIVALQTPFDMALQFLGLDRLPAHITDIKSGKKTLEEAAVEQLKDVGLGAPRTMYRLLNPFIQGTVGLTTNRDPYTRKEVVPERFKGTKYEKNYIGEYILSKVFAPYAQYMRMANEMEYTPELGKFGAWLMKGPIDILRAFGVRAADVDMTKMIEGYEARGELSNAVKNKLAVLERSWVKAFLMEGDKESTEYLQSSFKQVLKMEGPMPTNEQILNRLIHYRTQKEIFTRLAQKTKDADMRKEIQDYLKWLQENRFVEGMTENAMKAIRPELIERLTKIFEVKK